MKSKKTEPPYTLTIETDAGMRPMTVGHLKAILNEHANDKDTIIMLSDEEGNSQMPLYGIEINKGSVTFIPGNPIF